MSPMGEMWAILCGPLHVKSEQKYGVIVQTQRKTAGGLQRNLQCKQEYIIVYYVRSRSGRKIPPKSLNCRDHWSISRVPSACQACLIPL